MAPTEDSKSPFLRIPWTASLLQDPDLITWTPGSRLPKRTGEDSLFATTLSTPLTINSCVSVYKHPQPTDAHIEEVTTFFTLGTGMDGHPGILHGGIVASLLDEGMGILQAVNYERALGMKEGEGASSVLGSFTAFLNIRYLQPVRTSRAAVVVARFRKREGRKDWIDAEVRQCESGEDGAVVICARADALFVVPRVKKL